MPAPRSYPNKSLPPGQKLGCKTPRVEANSWCKSSGCVEGWLLQKLTAALPDQLVKTKLMSSI